MPHLNAASIHAESMVDLLRELALDLGTLWTRSNDEIWRQIDPEMWQITRNPWLMLQHASEQKLRSMAEDAELRRRVEQVVLARRTSTASAAWFEKTHAGSA